MGNSLDAAKLVATARAEERCGEEWVVIETAATLEAPKLGERESSGCSSPQSDQDLLNLSFDSGYEEPEQNAALEQPASNPGLQSKVKSRGGGYYFILLSVITTSMII